MTMVTSTARTAGTIQDRGREKTGLTGGIGRMLGATKSDPPCGAASLVIFGMPIRLRTNMTGALKIENILHQPIASVIEGRPRKVASPQSRQHGPCLLKNWV